MPTVSQITSAVAETQAIGDTILKTIGGLDPAVAIPAELAETILDLAAKYGTAALTAWSNAAGTPITVESVTALLPDQTPLPEPTAS